MTKRILAGAMMAVALVATGCGGSSAGDKDVEVASMKVELVANPDFGCNSVVICGEREREADGKYPCLSNFECKCFNFNEDGSLSADIPDLCPSKDVSVGPHGDIPAKWEFTYELWSGRCFEGEPTGVPLNPIITPDSGSIDLNPHNFACYDFDNRNALRLPNRSVEYLEPGCNENKIICVTENATKSFDFDVCVEVTPDCDSPNYDSSIDIAPMCPQPPTPPPGLVLDCGCRYFGDHGCLCPDGVLGTETTWPYGDADLPESCRFLDGLRLDSVDPAAPLTVVDGQDERCLVICGQQPQ